LLVAAEREGLEQQVAVLGIHQAGSDQLHRAHLVGRERQRRHDLLELGHQEMVVGSRLLDDRHLAGGERRVLDGGEQRLECGRGHGRKGRRRRHRLGARRRRGRRVRLVGRPRLAEDDARARRGHRFPAPDLVGAAVAFPQQDVVALGAPAAGDVETEPPLAVPHLEGSAAARHDRPLLAAAAIAGVDAHVVAAADAVPVAPAVAPPVMVPVATAVTDGEAQAILGVLDLAGGREVPDVVGVVVARPQLGVRAALGGPASGVEAHAQHAIAQLSPPGRHCRIGRRGPKIVRAPAVVAVAVVVVRVGDQVGQHQRCGQGGRNQEGAHGILLRRSLRRTRPGN
jgi:hypothetical protein